MDGYTELRMGSFDEVRTGMAAHEGATLLSLVADAFGGLGHGVPERWRHLVRSAVPRDAAQVLRPMFTRDYAVIPDCVTPTAGMPYGDVATQCERLGDLPPDMFLRELEKEFAGAVPPQWRAVVEHPRRWLQAFCRLLWSVWQQFRPVWKHAQGLIRGEIDRVGAAVVKGCGEALLMGISGRYRLVGDSFYLPDPQADTYDLGGRRLVLVPLVSGPSASMFALDGADHVWLGYPLPGVGRLRQASEVLPDPADDALSLVVGQLRAAALRASARPLTMGELAALLNCSPANATHHCRQLADAGLLDRQREGRSVRISRTERGDAMVDLLS